ncbi:MAG: cytidylate kinase-like family protein [Candidatus Hodarchaeales archaeon]|jgi:cytidylate kinase
MGTFIPRLKNFEKSLLSDFSQEIRDNKTPIIAIGGFSGTGKDTVAIIVQNFFEIHHNFSLNLIHAGEFVRKIAVESGWDEKNMDEFMAHIKNTQDDEFALKVDLEIEKHALKTALLDGGIFVGRMAPFAIGTHGTTIWLEVAAQVITQRLTNDPTRAEFRMNEDELIKKIQSRDQTDGDRLEKIYEISFRDKKLFDLTLRNESLTLLELEDIIIKLLKNKYPTENVED